MPSRFIKYPIRGNNNRWTMRYINVDQITYVDTAEDRVSFGLTGPDELPALTGESFEAFMREWTKLMDSDNAK